MRRAESPHAARGGRDETRNRGGWQRPARPHLHVPHPPAASLEETVGIGKRRAVAEPDVHVTRVVDEVAVGLAVDAEARRASVEDLVVRYEVGSGAEAPAPAAAGAEVTQVQRDEEERMLAEAGNDNSDIPRRDPEEAALELLQNELGARRIDGG